VSLRSDGHDIGHLLDYGLRPKARPGAEGDYTRLMHRYLDEITFREAFDAVLDGLHLRVLHAGDLGLVLTARRESAFAHRLSAESGSWTKEPARVLRGLAHLGIAAYAYPHPDDLHDPSVRYIDAIDCEKFIRRCCGELRDRADRVAAGEIDATVDLALAAGLDSGWSEWEKMPAAEVGTRGRAASRITSGSAVYWVLKACRDLVDHGLARSVGKEGDGRFQLLERFRHQVGASAAVEGYQVLAMLARTDRSLPDPHDPGETSPLPGRPPRFADRPDSPTTAGKAPSNNQGNRRSTPGRDDGPADEGLTA